MATNKTDYNLGFGSSLGGSIEDIWKIMEKFGLSGNNAYGAMRSGMLPGLMDRYYEQMDPTLGSRRAATIAGAEESATTSGRNTRNINEMPSWGNDPLIQRQRASEIEGLDRKSQLGKYSSDMYKIMYDRARSGYRDPRLADWELYDPVGDMLKMLLSGGY